MTTTYDLGLPRDEAAFFDTFAEIASTVGAYGDEGLPEHRHTFLLPVVEPKILIATRLHDRFDSDGNRTNTQLELTAVGEPLSEVPSPEQIDTNHYEVVASYPGDETLYMPTFASMILELQGRNDRPDWLASYAPYVYRGANTVGLQNESGIASPTQSLLVKLLAREFKLPEEFSLDDMAELADCVRYAGIATGNSYIEREIILRGGADSLQYVPNLTHTSQNPIVLEGVSPPDNLPPMKEAYSATTFRSTQSGALVETTTVLHVSHRKPASQAATADNVELQFTIERSKAVPELNPSAITTSEAQNIRQARIYLKPLADIARQVRQQRER